MLELPGGVECWRKCAKMRTQLFPYIYTASHEANQNGMPLMRHFILTHPHDPEALKQDYDYMFGESLLISPVINPKETQKKCLFTKRRCVV